MIKKFIVVWILILNVLHGLAQTGTIKGVAINSRTNERLPYASAFINHTTLGTSADEKGEFVLKNVPLGQHELIVTFIGHHFYQGKITIKDTAAITITIRLHSKELREVKIHSKRDKNWQRDYEKFKTLFLGTSIHAKRCEIVNPWILEFENNNRGFFKATASDVLQIENYSLGYTLYYEIKIFSVGSEEFFIHGNVRYKLMETSDSATGNQWTKNREDVYFGSSRHLFKAIAGRNSKSEGFELFKDNTGLDDIIRLANFYSNVGKEISEYDIVDRTHDEAMPAQYKIQIPSRMEVHYLNKADDPKVYRNVSNPISWIEVDKPYLIINSQGVVLNPYDMVLSGSMSKARIAEFLPYDFMPSPPKKSLIPTRQVNKKKPINALTYLLERPYLHTDKSYYYPNETIWFRGYMNYMTPVYKDSLSSVLYVDLIDSSQNIMASGIFPITNASVEGNLSVPPTVESGDYFLRAYTRWMLNFDSTLIYVKPLKILDYSEVGKVTDSSNVMDSVMTINIEVPKDTFETRELVTVKLGTKDFLENFIPANFSVSVTDAEQAVPAINETNILTDFSVPSIVLQDSFPGQVVHTIQRGIDFKGKFVTKRGKESQGVITVAQEKNAQVFIITTEEDGQFFFNNLKLYDSSKLSILAKTIKGRPGRVILDSVKRFSPRVKLKEPLKIEVVKESNPSKYNLLYPMGEARLLEEVTIRGLKPANSSNIISPDFAITGEWLRATNSTNILTSLQGRVPGLRVVNGTLLLGPPTSFGPSQSGGSVQSSAEPLVLIDGVPVNSMESFESLVDRLSQLSPHEIEKVEVLKYSSGASYGSRGANGVILITTRQSGDSTFENEKARFEEIHVAGFSGSKKFLMPNHLTNDNERADYRSTIYWNPNVKTDGSNVAQVSFYAADLPSQYRIVVEGITRDGKPVRGEKLIAIKEAR